MNRRSRTAHCLLLSVAAFAAAASPAAAVSNYFDGIFNPADWNQLIITNPTGAGSTSFASQVLTGGNPNEYRRIEINLVASEAGGAINTLHINNNAFYNPGTQGAITFINYSEDSINFQPNSGNGQGSGLLIIQGGTFYVQRNPILVMPQPAFTNWAPNAAPGLVAADLWEITPGGVLISSSNPDFSAAGGVMQLGFWRGASSGNSVGSFVRDAGIDNWSVRIVPAPAASALLLTAGLTAAARRRR